MPAKPVPVRPSRVGVNRIGAGVLITMHRQRPWWRWLQAGMSIAFLLLAPAIALFGDEPPEGGPILFLVWWVAGAGTFAAAAITGLLFREEIRLDAQLLTDIRRVGRLAKRRSYARTDIEDLRVSPENFVPFDFRGPFRTFGLGGGAVAFDYGDRTIRIADVSEAEAKRVIEALRAAGIDRGSS